ncbi:MAG: cysteine desulfurase family protein, partial [Flavobacteriales bacterium]
MAIYLDNAATTPIAPEVVEAMIPILQNDFGNPSSTHSFGRSSKALIEISRRSIAKHINCEPSELIFTSGGTEADNIALNSAIHKMGATHIITSAAEHHAVGHAADAIIQNNKIRISLVKLDEKGNVDLEDLERLLNSDEKAIVSLMHANNEISTLLPLKKVSQLCR